MLKPVPGTPKKGQCFDGVLHFVAVMDACNLQFATAPQHWMGHGSGLITISINHHHPVLIEGLLVGGLNHSEKYESIGMMTFPIYEKIKNVPNHQPGYIIAFYFDGSKDNRPVGQRGWFLMTLKQCQG